MKLHITRDSVALGDDIDAPHDASLTIHEPRSIPELVAAVIERYPLPRISAGRATWVLMSRVPLAVLAQEWSEPRTFTRPADWSRDLDWEGKTLRLHIRYLAQKPPDLVYEVLRDVVLHADS